MNNKQTGLPVQITLHTNDPVMVQAVQEYWQMDEGGKFIKPVSLIQRQFKELWPKGGYLDHIRGAATVFLRDVHCPECGSEIEVESRRTLLELAETLAAPESPGVVCGACRQQKAEDEEVAAQKKEDVAAYKLREQVKAMIEGDESPDRRLNYEETPFEVAIKLSAFDAWSGFALSDGIAPPLVGEGRVTPMRGGDYELLSLLYKNSVISPRPIDEKNLGASFKLNENGTVSWWHDKVRYALTPHVSGSLRDAMMLAGSRNPDSVDEVIKIWREVAVATCMSYLYSQLDQNSLSDPDAKAIEECERVIAGAIQVYSVAQAWSVIWRAVRDAAALCSQPYYNARNAAKTIPGKLDRAFKAARASGRVLPAYDRTLDNPVSELEIQLLERFGIDDYTSPQAIPALVAPHIRRTAPVKVEPGRFSPPEFDEAVRAVLGQGELYSLLKNEDEAIREVAYWMFLRDPTPEMEQAVEVIREIAIKRVRER